VPANKGDVQIYYATRGSSDGIPILGCVLKNSELHIYPGLGHEIPRPLWDEFATIIMRTAARA
jgi:hypothetical protein